MAQYATHYILVKRLIGWDKRIITLRDGGFNILDYENGRGHTDWVQFNDVISINYQFGTMNEVSLVWNKQSKSNEYKQMNWLIYSYDRDHLLSDYYRFYDAWREITIHLRGSLSGPSFWQAKVLHDNWFQESIRIEVRTSELILHLNGDLQEQTSIEQFSRKALILPSTYQPNRQIMIPFYSIGLINHHKNGIEFIWRSSHQRLTIWMQESACAGELISQIQKKQNQYLGFQNRINDKSDSNLPEPESSIFQMPKDLHLDPTQPVFEQTRNWNWNIPTLRFQMFAWRLLEGTNYIRRVLLGFEDKTLNEYDEISKDGKTQLTLLQRYPLKSITHVVRFDYAAARVAVMLICKDHSSPQYTFEPLQRDVFISSFYHFHDCSTYSSLQKDENNRTELVFGVLSQDAISKIPISSTPPNLGRKVYGWPNNEVDSAYERYLLQLLCSSKDETASFENAILLRLNLELQNFPDNSPVPLICLCQLADRVLTHYLKNEAQYNSFIKCHRFNRVLNSSTHKSMLLQFDDLKRSFESGYLDGEVNKHPIISSFSGMHAESNPVRLALGVSLFCSYQSFELLGENHPRAPSDPRSQYEQKMRALLDTAEEVLLQAGDSAPEEDEVHLTMLKMEEVLCLLVRLIRAPNIYREFVNSSINRELYQKVLLQVVQVACRIPQPLVSFLASEFIYHICYNPHMKSLGESMKSILFENNLFSQLVHAISSCTLVHEADSHSIQLSNIRRQSAMNDTHSTRVKSMLYLQDRTFPTSFLREELYTFHVLGYLRIISAFVSPFSRDSTKRADLKIILQYLQTPYIIASLNKSVHYKSPDVQAYSIAIIGSTLELLRQEMLDPEILHQQTLGLPCKALMLFSRNYELVQTLLMSRSTVSLKMLIKVLDNTDSSLVQYQLATWVISLLFYHNHQTSQLAISAFPIGILGYVSKFMSPHQQFSGDQCYSRREANWKVAQWNQEEWERFFLFVSTQDVRQPNAVWSQCERVWLKQQLKNYDYQFTYSQGAFLSQLQVDKIVNRDQQENDVIQSYIYIIFIKFLENTERDLFSNLWNIQQFKVDHISLHDLWQVNQYYLRILEENEDYIRQLPIDQAQALFYGLQIAYMNPECISHRTSVVKAFSLLYRLYPSTNLNLKSEWVTAIAKNAIFYLTDASTLQNMQAIQQHTEAIRAIAAVYVNSVSKDLRDLRAVWQTYQGNVIALVEGGGLDFLILQLSSTDESVKLKVLEILRLILLASQNGDSTNQHQFLQPYPIEKKMLVLQDGGVRVHALLNCLIREEETLKVKHDVLQIVCYQMNDIQTLLALIRLPMQTLTRIQFKNSFVEVFALCLCSTEKTFVEAAIKVFKSIYKLFQENATPLVLQRVFGYLDNGMFTRKVPYDQEREAISYLPYLRVIPFQLARKVIHQMTLEDGTQLLLRRQCEEYDLLWNNDSADGLSQYLKKNLQSYIDEISKQNSLQDYPIYKNTDGQQFRFIQSELQCGHIFLRLWIESKQRKSQIPGELLPYFINSITQLLEYLFNQFLEPQTQLNLLNQAQFQQFIVVLKAFYYCNKFYDCRGAEITNRVLLFFKNHIITSSQSTLKKQHTVQQLTLSVLLSKLVCLYQGLLDLTESHLQILLVYKSQHVGVSALETQLLKYLLRNQSVSLDVLAQTLILLQSYCELRVHSGSIVDEQFVQSPEALRGLFNLAPILSQHLQQLNIDQQQGLIKMGIVWRMIYLITLFPHYYDGEQSSIKTMKILIIETTLSLRNILLNAHDQVEFCESMSTLFVQNFLDTLLQKTDNPMQAVIRFLLKVSTDTQEATMVWNELTRRDLRAVLNRQLACAGNTNFLKEFRYNSQETQVDGVYLAVINQQKQQFPTMQLPIGFVEKVADTMVSATVLISFVDCARTLGLLVNENIEVAKQLYTYLPQMQETLQGLRKRIQDSGLIDVEKQDMLFGVVKSYYQILKGICTESCGSQLLRKHPIMLIELGGFARQATKGTEFLLQEYCQLIPRVFNINEFDCIKEVVALGVVGLLWEALLKDDLIPMELRQEVFSLWKIILQTEFSLFKSNEQESIRPQNQLEVFRIAQGLPLHLIDVNYRIQQIIIIATIW